MKISNLAKAIKSNKQLNVLTTADSNGEMFQMIGYAGNLYRINNMPILNDVQMLTFLGMAKEDKGKLNYKEQTLTHDIFLDDYVGEEQMFWSTLASDHEITVFWSVALNNDEVVFAMSDSFGLADVTGSTRAFLRKSKHMTYIAIKEGMFLKALIVPQEVTVERLLERLDRERKLLERAKRNA